ncbi:hypothetical protein EB233_18330 [Mesorhizobium erdmanii]|uniref:Uncharacterized protein n=1 Tax=Mesorhizobium erdmanii TaxID=1777866 RepID=A0A6M7UJ85_9HYPH|nr:hypothetical protein EB233_18330 [Mesorhizobium erdmanii]
MPASTRSFRCAGHAGAKSDRRSKHSGSRYRRIRAGDADQRSLGGVTVNPLKSEALAYLPEHRIIVLARD